MKIALLGYGKMGKAIEALALERGHQIGAVVDDASQWPDQEQKVKGCDVAIEFSMPSTAVDNIHRCFALHIPIVVGTTGWYNQLESIVEQCKREQQSLFVASNFSIGMNIMFDLNRRLAHLMSRYPEYKADISETHHVHKLDAPSGTAITLANDMIAANPHYNQWSLCDEVWIDANGAVDNNKSTHPHPQVEANEVPIHSERRGEVAGIHSVVYDSAVDTITLSHSAKSRRGLALGAMIAAEFVQHKQGYFTMRDLIND